MLRALLFIPASDPHLRKWMVVLWTYCMRRLYRPEAVVHEWDDVRRLMLDGAADKVIVATLEHLDWLEVVNQMPEPDRPASCQQRTGRT